jgi:hypothetical protein
MPAVVFTDQEARAILDAIEIAINAICDFPEGEEDNELVARLQSIAKRIQED